MVRQVTVSKEDYFDFLNRSTFLQYYYSMYLQHYLEDPLIEYNAKLLEELIREDAFHKIKDNAQKKLFSSAYLLPLQDYQNMMSIRKMTAQLEKLLTRNGLL